MASSSGRQPNFAALNRGRHLYSAGRPSRWALAHVSSSVFIVLEHCHLFTRVVCTCVHCSPEVPNIPHKAELQSAFPRDEMEYFDWKLSSDTFPKFAKLLSLSTYTYYILLGLTVSAGGLTESLVRFHLTIFFVLFCTVNAMMPKNCFEKGSVFLLVHWS